MGKIIALCTSKIKGRQKEEIPEAFFIADYGMQDDAHSGNWHRQISPIAP